MESLVVVTHPEPIHIEARPMDTMEAPEGSVALGYYHEGHVVARGVVAEEAVEAITGLLASPVSLALAAMEDEEGNIDARVCLVLSVDAEELGGEDEEGADEPWKASLPPAPQLGEEEWSEDGGEADGPRLALLPIGNAVRGARDRRHENVEGDAREMLENLLAGRGKDAVSKAIDDLLDSL